VSFADLMGSQNKQGEKRILTFLEVAGMFQAAEYNKRDCMLLKCLYYLGLKSSEVQNLRVEDADFESCKVKVFKGDKKTSRYVSIPEGFGEELRGFVNGKMGYIFSGGSNGLVSDRHVRRLVKAYACKAEIQKWSEINPHSLREAYFHHLNNI